MRRLHSLSNLINSRALLRNNRRPSLYFSDSVSTSILPPRFYIQPSTIQVPRSAKSPTRARSSSTIRPAATTPTTSTMPLQIRAISAEDEAVWKSLWEQYNQFYKRTIPAEVTQTTFERFLDPSVRMYCALAVDDGTSKVIGFTTWHPHYTTSSIQEIVYLQDLFVDPSVRNKGAGRTLIEHVYEHAKTIPVNSVYWNTQYFNYVGQILYNKVASRTDFIRYQKNF